MKYTLLLLTTIIFISCGNQKKSVDQKSNLDWLIGDWIRTNNKENNITREHWVKHGDNQYYGFGYTMVGEDTIFQEEMQIFYRDSVWILAVIMPEDSVETEFAFTKLDDQSFVSENPDNEFPKIIRYFKTSEGLNATISGNGMDVEFVFEPIEP